MCPIGCVTRGQWNENVVKPQRGTRRLPPRFRFAESIGKPGGCADTFQACRRRRAGAIFQRIMCIIMPNGSFGLVIAVSLLAALATTAGIFIISRHREWARRHRIYFISFAAGILVAISFIHLTPRSYQLNPSAPAFVLGGFLALHLFNRLTMSFVCGREESGEEEGACSVGFLAMIGIGFHSLIDGVIYSITFSVSSFTGLLVAVGMVLHELPEGIVTYSLLQHGGYSSRKSFIYAFLAAGLTTPVGAAISFPFISVLSGGVLGALLGVASGALTYVGATHLFPAVEKTGTNRTFLTTAAGVAVAVAIVMIRHWTQ